MEILGVSFKNFSRIYSGLGKTYIYINFKTMRNKIFLFVGENGSAKTSILRALHPFAYNSGAGDNTANSDLIIEKADGEKTISYSHNKHRYDISHIYSRKKDDSLSVKSFIQEDGVELNESGTVKTFKDIILQKLGLDESFLGLLSLGNTIDGFVKYTSANRKKFAVKIFSQLSVYDKYYKKVSIKVRDTKSVLNNVITKLERYKAYSIEDLELHQIELERELSNLKNELQTISMNIGSVLQVIRDNEEFIQHYDQKRHQFDELLNQIDRIKQKVTTKKDLVVLENDRTSIQTNVNNEKITISGLESSISSELDLRDSKVSTIKSLKTSMTRMEQSIDLKELTELKASLEKELSIILAKQLPQRPDWNKEDLVKINIYLDELTGMCIDLVTNVNNVSIISSALKDYLKNHDVAKKISRQLEELTYSYNQERALTLSKSLLDTMHVRKIVSKCEATDSCPYVKFYQDAMSIIQQSVEDTDTFLRERKKDVDDIGDRLTAVNIINKLYKFIDMNKSYFALPKELFDAELFILQYLENRTIYDSTYLTYIIELEESYERKDYLESKIAEVSNQIDTISNSTEVYHTMSSEVEQLESSVSDIDVRVAHQRNDLDYHKKNLDELESICDDIQKQIEILKELESARSEFNSVKSELVIMETKMGDIDKARKDHKAYELKKASLETSMNQMEDQLRRTQVIINSINDLKKEQKELMEKYEMDKLVLEAVSPTTGIPLEFINYYIKEKMINKVNELLDMVYHGKLRLVKSKVVIDEEEFTIPYTKRGRLISDISKASDGEKAIISLAFSLVLLNITAGPYNILLLDEMDTTLDTESRAKYIELLEQYMKTIKANQLFLISHNSMFDVYPVNVILTSPSVVNVDSSNVIKLYEQD